MSYITETTWSPVGYVFEAYIVVEMQLHISTYPEWN
jgi:hypothetical protein